MKKLQIALILFSISFLVNAQQSKIDSLTIEFSKANQDTIKANLLSEIVMLAYRIDLGSVALILLIQIYLSLRFPK